MEIESYKQHQLFKQTIDHFAQALPGGYRGSRKVAMRYIYPRTTLANFIELKFEESPMRPAEFLELLSAVPEVLEVVLHPKSKLEHETVSTTQDVKPRLCQAMASVRRLVCQALVGPGSASP